jgi:hypothetical protein
MIILQNIVFFDISSVIAMLIVAALSKTIGEALKIKPYYKFLYFTSACVMVSAIIDTVPFKTNIEELKTITLALRCIAGLIALPVCLRYWKWLISEFFKN